MNTTDTNKGIAGYSLCGIQGLIGASGNSIYYSSVEEPTDICELIKNHKTLSNNPIVQETEIEYLNNDFIITPNGDFYVIKNISSTPVLIERLGNIMISYKNEPDNDHIPPETIYLVKPKISTFNPSTDAVETQNKYNYVGLSARKSSLYRHIIDSNRRTFAGIKIKIDKNVPISCIFNGGTSSYAHTYKFLESTITIFKDTKLVFLFKSGYSLEWYLKNGSDDSGRLAFSDGYIVIDNRYVYYQGVDQSTYDSSKGDYSDHNIPYTKNNTMKNLLDIAFSDGDEVVTYLEYFFNGKNYKVRVTYV